MLITDGVKSVLRLTQFKAIQSILFILIPLVLIIANKGVVLDSISAYVNHTPVAFTCTLTLAGCLFIYDGVQYKRRVYNIYIGLALFGVIFFNHLTHPVTHYVFAILFFIGSLFNMVFFSSKKERTWKIVTAIGTLFGMAGCFIFNWYSIFWAEWIGMLPICVHFMLESLGKID